jgi:hypothetical protein
MPDKKKKSPLPSGRVQNRLSNVILYPLSPDDAMRRVLSISKADAKRIVQSKPGKKGKT